MKTKLMFQALVFALIASIAASARGLTTCEARSIAKEAYILGVPMVDCYKTIFAFNVDKTNPQYKGPFKILAK